MLKKRFTSLFLALAMLLGLSGQAFAADIHGDDSDGIDIIVVNGQEVQVRESLSNEKRDKLIRLMTEIGFQPEGVVCDVQSAISKAPTIGGVSPYVIDTDLFENIIVAQKVPMSGYAAFKLSAVGVWKDPNKPTFVFDDVMAIAWSGGFSLYDNVATTYYRTPDGVSHKLDGQAVLSDVTPSAGLAYTVPMRVMDSTGTFNYYWYMQVDAYIRTPAGKPGTANAVVKYAHKYIGGAINVSFDGSLTPSIKFTGAAIEDTSSPDYCEFSW